MGTKFLFLIDQLATSGNHHFWASHLDVWDYLRDIVLENSLRRPRPGLERFQNLMERMLEPHTIESLKRTMLMHEEIFKHQVRELHRLYSVQRMLMDELKNAMKPTRIWVGITGSSINHSHFVNQTQPVESHGCDPHLSVRDDQRSRKRSGSCSGDALRMTKGFVLERPVEDDISGGISAIEDGQAGPSCQRPRENSKTHVDGDEEESEVELTLSIGRPTSKNNRSKVHQQHCSLQLGDSQSNHNEFMELDSFASIKPDRGEEHNDLNNGAGQRRGTQ
ncbi:unnamed protein product [Ilex paraguariensis]|uniref:Uncharacterized protein n=1 Tax=Ilex paraguariensis TaxID=185542 RepID=A0ABC8UMX2_9AQUA